MNRFNLLRIVVLLAAAVICRAAPHASAAGEFILPLDREDAVAKVWGDIRLFPEPRGSWGKEEAQAAHRRAAAVGAASNGILDVGPLAAPAEPLRLNLDARRGDLALSQQAYVMVEVLDENGDVILPFQKEQCLLVDVNDLGRELQWDSVNTASLAGQKVILRFYLRDARLYALHTVAPPPAKPLARVEMVWPVTGLAAWDTTSFAVRGFDAGGRVVNLDRADMRFRTVSVDTPLHLKSDQRDRERGYATVPADIPAKSSVEVHAEVSLDGVAVASAPVQITLRPGTSAAVKVRDQRVQLFMRPADITDASGPVEFRANTLGYYAETQGLPTTVLAMTVYNREIDGRHHVWGSSREEGGLFRAETRDGIRFEDVRSLQSEIASRHLMTMVYNPRARRYLAFERVLNPLRWRAHFSEDGTVFTPAGESVYHDHDATNLLWDEAGNRYLAMAVTYQQLPAPRRYSDNLRWESQLGIGLRRVLSVRHSADGIHWIPDTDVFQGKPETWLKREHLIEPDAGDPPDSEHYWFNGFRYHDRWIGIVLTYAPSPAAVLERFPYDPYPSKHGPHLGTEWWVSDDGVRWERPYRGTPATPDLRIYFNHAPLVRHDRLLFLTSNQIYNFPPVDGTPGYHGARPGQNMEVYSLPLDRIASAGSEAPASFSSPAFVMPEGGLRLNYEHAGTLTVELLDEEGRVVRGYSRQQNSVPPGSHLAAPPRWRDRSGGELAGRTVCIRFHTENARVYALYSDRSPEP